MTCKVEGSGRKKGTPNKKTIELRDLISKHHFEPFEALIHIAKGELPNTENCEISLDIRFKAIKELCSYLYPKRKAVEIVKEEKGQTIEEIISNIKQQDLK